MKGKMFQCANFLELMVVEVIGFMRQLRGFDAEPYG
jgi:hypothetical protein